MFEADLYAGHASSLPMLNYPHLSSLGPCAVTLSQQVLGLPPLVTTMFGALIPEVGRRCLILLLCGSSQAT